MVALSTSNPRYEDVPLNIPPFQWSSDLSYWDASMGAVSDSNRKIMWLSLAILTLLVTLIVGFTMTAILIKPEARRKPYNLFLVFLMIPDILFNVADPPIYLLNYMAGKYISVEACKFQGFLIGFGAIANCHINALIALEIHRMLCDSDGRKRYFPPSAFQVSARCFTSYFVGATVVLVWALNFENFPGRVFLTGGGVFCGPGPYDTNSAFAYHLFLVPFALYIPLGICGYVTLDVLRRGLLPKRGEGKRVLTIFFFRLNLVYIVFWAPAITSAFVSTNPWFAFVGGLWGHSQGAVSAIAMLGKQDVYDCVMDLLAQVSCGLFSALEASTKVDNNQDSLPVSTGKHGANGRHSTNKSSVYCDDFSEEENDDPGNQFQWVDRTTSPSPGSQHVHDNDEETNDLPAVFDNEPF